MRYQDFFTYDEVDGFRPRRMAGPGGGGVAGPFASWEEEEGGEDDDEAQARVRDSGGRAAAAAAAAAALARKAADEDVKVRYHACPQIDLAATPQPSHPPPFPHRYRSLRAVLYCGVQAQAHDFQPYWGRAMEAAAQGPGGRRRPGSGGRHSPRPDDPSLTATHVPRALVLDRPAPAAAARPSRRNTSSSASSSLLEYAGADAGRLLRLGPHGDGGDDEPRRSRLRERDKHFWGDATTSELAELLARPAPPPTPSSTPLAPAAAAAATGGGSGRAPSPTRRGRGSRDVDKDTAANTAANRNLSAVRGGERGLVPLAAATRRRYFSVELLDPQVRPYLGLYLGPYPGLYLAPI